MPKVIFVLGIHNHQPVGNFESVFEDAYQSAYRPFLETVARHPHVRLALHNTGILIEWFKRHHPDYIELVRRLAGEGRLEVMTGGYYEPLISVIPDEDRLGQVAKLSDLLAKEFNVRPRGMWLAERVWEPHLPRYLKAAGVDYTVLDNSHFRCSGLTEEQTLTYYLTDELGDSVAVFPISEKLRYTIPFKPPQATIDYLRRLAETSDHTPIVVMADDGEKFGVWPKTHEHCYVKGWLDQFFAALEENRDWIEMLTFSEVLDRFRPGGIVYLQTASYFEMLEWAMPADAIVQYERFLHELEERGLLDGNRVFVRGGFWRNFFTKYPESNQIHKRMIRLSRQIHDALSRRPDDGTLLAARDELWKAQCNCAYWHGVFGGLYLPHLRGALYHHIIRGKKLLKQALGEDRKGPIVYESDFDGDGSPEIIVDSPVQWLAFQPHNGGALIEHDDYDKEFNLLDTLARRREAYHDKVARAVLVSADARQEQGDSTASIHDLVLAKEDGLERLLNYDWHRRLSLIDHFIRPGTTLEQFQAVRYQEDGDFVNQPYEARVAKSRKRIALTLARAGGLYLPEGRCPLTVSKEIVIEAARKGFTAAYRITNDGDRPVHTVFGVEFGVNFRAGDAPDRYYFATGAVMTANRLRTGGEHREVTEFGAVDEWLGLRLTLRVDRAATLWRFPIESVSLSEAGFERVYQSSVLMPHWSLTLAPGQNWSVNIDYRLD
ncbi:MAG: DUF1926 domain-containing protein [Candidatus Sumerlaeia bacterium]